MDARNDLIASLMIRPVEQEAQLPCRVLLMGDYRGNLPDESFQGTQIKLQADQPARAMEELACAIDFSALMPEWSEAYRIRALDDFSPQALIQASPVLSLGVSLRDRLLSDNPVPGALAAQARQFLGRYSPLSDAELSDDFLYADLEVCLSELLNQLLHFPPFAQLESRWRQLCHLADATRNHRLSEIVLLHIDKKTLADDLSGSSVTDSMLFDRVYSHEFGQFGGQPFNLLVADFYLQQTAPDLALLRALGQVGRSAHLPVVAPVSPDFLGFKGYEQLLGQSLSEWLENPRFMPLQHLAQGAESRYLFLVMPDQVVRSPYQGHYGGLYFQEQLDAGGDSLLWGSSVSSVAAAVLNSFDTQGSFSQMTGSVFGREPLHSPYKDPLADLWLSPLKVALPTSVLADLARHGLCVLSPLPELNSSYFAQLNSLHVLALEGEQVAPDAQLPFMLTVCRIAHMMKRIFREQIGSMDEPELLRQKLEQWLKNFVVDLESPALDVMMKKPFRSADVVLKRTGDCFMEVRLQPHLRYMDERFQLSLDLILQEAV